LPVRPVGYAPRMTSQPTPPLPAAAVVAEGLTDEETKLLKPDPEDKDARVDDDGTPVGRADRDADIIRSGGEPDEV
jgi:hypothetical protein